MSGRVLVTGAGGFVGRPLCGLLAERGWTVTAADLQAPAPDGAVALDVTDGEAARAVLAQAAPDVVLHLAAQSHVPTSFRDPLGTWRVNALGTLTLLEALRELGSDAAFVLISTAEVYGDAFAAGTPVPETAPLAPRNPYAASKAAADDLVRAAACERRTLVLRPFNHVGPGQREDFVLPAFAAQIARIEAGLQDPVLRVGNLDARRDFLDVRDVLEAYALVLDRLDDLPSGAAFNVCSGSTRRIGSLLDDLLARSDARIVVEQDPERLRPSDVPVACGDGGALREAVGWAPSTPWEETLARVLEDWRRRVRVV
ncbi:MAG TPA: GDP-mannose 4,6-dehydratase [Candidatus Krumholzibacteria bacterium]|nr:GDP-mannose 4,6-dehydratase [Candidatus Krumholzibacteria bacterium]HRX51819.1 GDP-mannose 4,6-dehydratase [Candidatus Krumholzibacteria bacterium]